MSFADRRRHPPPGRLKESAALARGMDPREGLHRLIYTSVAMPPGAVSGEPSTSVVEITAASKKANRDLRLSGVLIHVRGHFIQVVEGDASAIENVFERICCDLRHSSLVLVDFSPVPERLFHEWTMVPIDASLTADPGPLEDLLMTIRDGMAPAAIVGVIRLLLDEYRPAAA